MKRQSLLHRQTQAQGGFCAHGIGIFDGCLRDHSTQEKKNGGCVATLR